MAEADRLGLTYHKNKTTYLYGYGNGSTPTLGVATLNIVIDEIEADIKAYVVPNAVQEVPVILGRNFTEQPGILVVKDDVTLRFFKRDNQTLTSIEPDFVESKKKLRIASDFTLLPDHCGQIPVYSDEFEGDVYIESSIRHQTGREYCVPRTVISLRKGKLSFVPCINLSNNLITFGRGNVFTRADQCVEETRSPEIINTVREKFRQDFTLDEITVGPINEEQKLKLLELLNNYRDCFASTLEELGSAKSAKMEIKLIEDKSFSYRPYRMSRSQQDQVKEIIDDLLINNIICESDSEYSSPILLVKKKNGEQRLCVDYRKLNSLTVRDSHPLPRIDDQIDKLQAGNWFISLDLKCGYHQVPLEESSKHYTSFVTPEGQYEYNKVPFGLTNAPRVFQRLITKIFKPIRGSSAIYLDDVLLYSATINGALEILKQALDILRQEGMTLNLKKCMFLQNTVLYLGYEIGQGMVRPGTEKIKAAQIEQKKYYDRKGKKARSYKEGDLVLVQKQVPSTGTSRKLAAPYSGPMMVQTVLPNDRYVVKDMNDSHRTLRSSKYEKIVAVDRMRPWCTPGGVSDDTGSESGEDDIILSSEEDEQKEETTN